MFMTNYELIYGCNKETSNDSVCFIKKENHVPTKENGNDTEIDVNAAKTVVGAHITAAKFAGGAISNLSKKAIDYAKSDDAAGKADFVKGKAGSIFNGLKDKAAGFIAERNKPNDENDDNCGEEIASVTNSINDSSTSTATNQIIQSSDYQRQFSYEEEKKTPIVFVLIGVIAVLLVGIGILGGMLLMKNKNDKGNISATNVTTTSTVVVTENAVNTTVVTGISSTKTTTVQTTLPADSGQNTLNVYPASDISNYPQYIEVIKECINSSNFTVNDANYSLIDLNGDDNPELFIKSGNGSGIYGIIDNHYVELFRSYGALHPPGLWFTDKGYLRQSSIDSAGSEYYESILQYNGETKLEVIDSVYQNSINQTYSHNTTPISSDEYEKIRSQYGNNIDILFTPVSNIADINSFISASNPSKPTISAQLNVVQGFQGVGIILNVTGNYSYYSYESYQYGPLTKNPTIKSGNSSESEIEITAFDGGVNKVVVNVTPYNSNGVAGDMVSATYTRESSNINAVTSCTKYGNIYSPSGNKVDGLTRSYLIDGGAATYERHDLTDGWHIVAVNQYYDGSVYWYELYDADDGDYYGWVNSANIAFY